MAKATVRKPVATIQNEGAQVIRKLRRDAEALVARGRAEVMKDVRAVRSSADRAVRELERRVVRQFHAATEDQLKRLERRVAKLERLVAEVAAKVKCVFEAIQPPGVDPMLDFDERDLLEWAESAGFRDVHLTLEAEVVPLDRVSPEPPGWDAMLRIAGNPRIPSLGEAMERALTPDEREVFVSHLRPLVEAKQGVHASAMAYLWATKH